MNQVKKTVLGITTAFAVLAACTPAVAETLYAPAKIVKVWEEYKTVTTYQNRHECRQEQVPIYGNSGSRDTTGDMIIGGIIGGVIGNQFGKGGGKNAATGIGAVTGAIIANNHANQHNNNNNIVGYQNVEKCYNISEPTQSRQVTGYTFKYVLDADKKRREVKAFTKNRVWVGQKITVRLHPEVHSFN